MGSTVYGLKYQARALAAVRADTERIRFLAGTLSIKQDNEIHLIDFDEEEREISSQVFRHPSEVWHIAPSPSKDDLFFTCYNTATESAQELCAALWKIDTEPTPPTERRDFASVKPLQQLLVLPSQDESVRSVLWNPGESSKFAAFYDTTFRLWDLEASKKASISSTIKVPAEDKKTSVKLMCGCWNPHNTNQLITANDTTLRAWDLRTTHSTFTVEQAHGVRIRDLDFNSNKPNQFVSSGDDRAIRFWDTRKLMKPLLEISHHSHWIWQVEYNRFHDQLVLTASSDSRVNLESVVSIASSALTEDDDDEKKTYERPKDGLIHSYDDHDESVYAIAWSAADPWIFASLSYDGRLVISFVPKEEKYKIIL